MQRRLPFFEIAVAGPANHAAVRLLWEQAAINTFLDTRQQAISLFASKGYSNVGMRELASALGIKCGSIYNHIESKEALLYELFEELLGLLQTKAMQIQRKTEAPKRLRKIIEMHLSLQDRMPCHFQLLEQEWRHLSEPWLDQADAHRARYEQIIAAAIGPSACSHTCTKGIVTLLNQAPAWLPALRLSGSARLDLVYAMVELIIAQAFSNSSGQRTGGSTIRAS
ncbi:TetR/AcrR family transcriptional regulator [Pseudomonas sp. TH10]|uniref:TetR/AcrR family transcriptional regulator n=1 Tax=Pseudomonas sp. TH10 TaxID=2796376 RepID=UPI001F5B3A10|nr:TetR/AcrR family transcriptional regulator [Pseudomonas sp. TH10]